MNEFRGKNKFIKSLLLTLAMFAFIANLKAQTSATLNFSGLQNNEYPREFYNGGAGSLGSTGGANYGISFVNNRNNSQSGKVETQFTSPQLRADFRNVTINVANGFTTSVSFRYKRIDTNDPNFCAVRAMSDLTLGGTELGRLTLPQAGTTFDTSTSPLTTFTFSGTAKSLEFICAGDYLAVDDLSFNLNAGTPTNPTNTSLRYADFDGDGKTDISVYRPSNGTWFIRPSTAETTFRGIQWGTNGDVNVPVDFDGDGKSDIAVWRGGNGFFYILNSATNTVRTEQFGTTGDNPTVSGDWDGDGKADLAVYRDGSPQSYFYYRGSANNPNGNITYLPWGTNFDTAIFGDFDGDRRLDTCVYRPSNNTFYVRQSSNGAVRIQQWGDAFTDAIFAGDFDGDGKSDFAVQRFSGATAGNWFVLQSGGNPSVKAFQWGLGSDTPVPADYDGDGKMDFAVYRRSDRYWYIHQSASNTAKIVQFGLSNDFPIPLNYIR